jgi:hypothetical protein
MLSPIVSDGFDAAPPADAADSITNHVAAAAATTLTPRMKAPCLAFARVDPTAPPARDYQPPLPRAGAAEVRQCRTLNTR